MQTKQQIKLAISCPTIATAQANNHQLLRLTFTVTHAARVKRLSQTEATCLIPSVSSDLHCFGRATDEMRSQQLHSSSSPIRALVKPECRFNTKSCKTNKALTNPIWFRTLEHVNRTRLVLMKSKIIFCSLVLTNGRSGGVHFLVPYRHVASTRSPEWRRLGSLAEHVLVCSIC